MCNSYYSHSEGPEIKRNFENIEVPVNRKASGTILAQRQILSTTCFSITPLLKQTRQQAGSSCDAPDEDCRHSQAQAQAHGLKFSVRPTTVDTSAFQCPATHWCIITNHAPIASNKSLEIKTMHEGPQKNCNRVNPKGLL